MSVHTLQSAAALTRRDMLRVGLTGLAGLALGGLGGRLLGGGDPATGPNLVVILADDLGYGDLRCYGGDIPTPHVDALAAAGVRYTAAYAAAPVCGPSRAGLLTGQCPQRFGFEANTGGDDARTRRQRRGLPPGTETLAGRLGEAGYATALVGKWHLGLTDAQRPRAMGFAEVGSWLRYAPYRRQGGHLCEYVRTAARRAIADLADPFALVVATKAPHADRGDYAPEARFDPGSGASLRGRYAAMVRSFDQTVGAVVDALEVRGVLDRTLIVVASDNGGAERYGASNGGLRSEGPDRGKACLYEGGIRVPLVARYPAGWGAGTVEERPVSLLDVIPTALALAERPVPAGLDGRDLRHPDADRTLCWRWMDQWAIRRGRWKLVCGRRHAYAADGPPASLYDLAADPAETTDLLAERPEVAADLARRWLAWAQPLPEPRWRLPWTEKVESRPWRETAAACAAMAE